MSITLPCFHEGKFIGVAGTDINMDDLLSDITFLNQGQSTYAFMISNSGRTLIHPLLPAPTDAYGDPVFLDIRTLEPEKEFEEVFDSMKRSVCLTYAPCDPSCYGFNIQYFGIIKVCFAKQKAFLPLRKLEGVPPLNLARYNNFFLF